MLIQSFLSGVILCGGIGILRDSGARRALLFEGAAGGKTGAVVGTGREGAEVSIMSSSSSSREGSGIGNREEVSMGWEGVSVISASSSSLCCEDEPRGSCGVVPGTEADFLCILRRFLRFVDVV